MLDAKGRRLGPAGVRVSAKHTARLLVADSERNADMYYATRVFVPDPFVFFEFRGRKHILIGSMEYPRVEREADVDEVHSFDQVRRKFGLSNRPKAPQLPDICRALFLDLGIRRILAPRSFPLGFAEDLQNLGFQVVCGPDPFFPSRAVKSGAEVEAMRKVLQATEHGMKVAAHVLRESIVDKNKGADLFLGGERLTADRLRFLIHKALLERECTAKQTIVACGPQGYDPHERGTGPLRAGEPIIVDIFPRSDISGYYGDMTRTFVKGRAPERVRSMYRAVREAQDFAISNVKPGIMSRCVHDGVKRVFQAAGFPQDERDGKNVGFIHGTGHGLGLDIHEYPWIGQRSCRLVSGNVVTVEPGLYYPDVGGVRLEDVVLVCKDGATKLTKMERRLEVP